MAKHVYKIPSSIDRSFLDQEISLSSKNFKVRPLPVKVVLFWVASIFGLFWFVSNSFLKSADWWLTTLVVIWWLLTTAFLGTYSKTKEMKFASVPALMNYLPKTSRQVVTRKSSDPSAFFSISGVKDIDASGVINWIDGTCGIAYLVVGSASLLVFEQDKNSILNRVDSFYRKVDTTTEFIWLTTKEPQRVYRQLANLENRNVNLKVQDEELRELMEEQYEILTSFVGSSFTSIHQYLVLKSDNEESLRRAKHLVESEGMESSLMFKQLTRLSRTETQDMFATVYGGAQ